MTTYNITGHALDGTEVWGPYTADNDAAWIKVRISTPAHADPDYQRMFFEPVPILIERSSNGIDWEHFGSITIHGDDLHYPEDTTFDRDSFDPAQYWVSIREDGYQYRVTVTTTYSQVISGSVEFDTSVSRFNPSTGGGIEITDCTFVRVYGPGGHGSGPYSRFTTPLLDIGTDNPGIIVINPEQHQIYDLDGLSCTNNYPNASTGDFKKVFWGLNGTEIPLVSRAGRECTVNTPIYVKTGISDDRDYIHVEYENTYPEGWLDEGTPPEEREVAYCPQFSCAVLIVKNLDQASPVYDTWESHPTNSPANDGAVDYDGNPVGFTTTKTTVVGQLIVNSAVIMGVVDSESDPYTSPVAGYTSLFDTYSNWAQDEWAFGASLRIASSTSHTVGHYVGYTPGSGVSNPYDAANSVLLSETQYCHYVAVETPADPGDRPDADQIRAGTDGFDSPALDAQSRGPDESGTVTFDPFSDNSIAPGTNITLCYVWEDEAFPVYYELTTTAAVYHVAVETPVDDNDRPNAAQIYAGTDGFDDPALDVQAKAGVTGTITFDPFTVADPATDYTLCFVYTEDAVIFEEPVYYELTTLEGDISVNATVVSLTLTEYTVSVSYDVAMSASTDSLSLTEYAANVNAETNILANSDSLILTEYSATVSAEKVNVLAGYDSLSISTYQADIIGASPQAGVGGWGFINAFQIEQSRYKRIKEEREKLLAQIQSIEDQTEREIAQFLQKQEAEDERRNELARIGSLARQYAEEVSEDLYGERVVKAMTRALVQGNYSALEALEREMNRMKEEEEFLLEAARIILYD